MANSYTAQRTGRGAALTQARRCRPHSCSTSTSTSNAMPNNSKSSSSLLVRPSSQYWANTSCPGLCRIPAKYAAALPKLLVRKMVKVVTKMANVSGTPTMRSGRDLRLRSGAGMWSSATWHRPCSPPQTRKVQVGTVPQPADQKGQQQVGHPRPGNALRLPPVGYTHNPGTTAKG